MTKEGKIVSAINKYLKDEGWFQVNLIHTSINGIPDRLIFKGGRYIWIEIKEPNGRLSPIQEYRIEQMIKQGMEVYTVYSLNDLKEKIYGRENS